PEVLKGLVLLDPSDPDGRGAGFPVDGPALDQLIDARMAARRAQLEKGRDAVGLSGAPAELMRALDADMRAAPEARLRGSMRSMFSLNLGARVKALPMPVLVACGDADATIPLASMLATWAKYPQGTGLHIWHGAGHSPNLDRPEELAGLLAQFIETTIPTAGPRLSDERVVNFHVSGRRI
ncbi:MAG: alpha/beta fold hydrolase, partial [Caulobacteraceae bacterium]